MAIKITEPCVKNVMPKYTEKTQNDWKISFRIVKGGNFITQSIQSIPRIFRTLNMATKFADLPHHVRTTYYDVRNIIDEYSGMIIDKALRADMENRLYDKTKKLSFDELNELAEYFHSTNQQFISDKLTDISQRFKTVGDFGIDDLDNNLTEDERHEKKMELITRKEKQFYFGKDKDNWDCDCGAAFTGSPNQHSDYCTTFKRKNNHINFMD